jgi:hypothetical protein
MREKDVKPHDHRRGRDPIDALSGRTPEEIAAAHERALAWRAGWRNELAGNGKQATPQAAPRPPEDDARRRARYASQVARAELGRFYWSDALGRRMREEMDRSHRSKQEEQSRRLARERTHRRRHDGAG